MMRKIITILFLVFSGLFSLSSFVYAQAPREERTHQVITVSKGEVIETDSYIKAGDVVEISGTVVGDVYIAGGQVIVDGTVDGDLLVAGGTVNISGTITNDARLVGGDVSVNGTIGDDLTLVGGTLNIEKSARIEGGLVIAGGSVIISAPIRADVKVAAGNLVVASDIDGDVEAYVGTLRLTSSSNISGNFEYTSDQEVSIDNNASISGSITRKTLPYWVGTADVAAMEEFKKGADKIGAYLKFSSFISALLVGLFVIKFFPNCMKNSSEIVSNQPWKTMAIGLAVFFLTPLVLVLLAFTLIGLPIALIGLTVYITFLYFTKIVFSYWVGDQIKSRLGLKSIYLSFGLGLVLFYALKSIFLVGFIVSIASIAFGFGAMVSGIRESYNKALKAKVI